MNLAIIFLGLIGSVLITAFVLAFISEYRIQRRYKQKVSDFEKWERSAERDQDVYEENDLAKQRRSAFSAHEQKPVI